MVSPSKLSDPSGKSASSASTSSRPPSTSSSSSSRAARAQFRAELEAQDGLLILDDTFQVEDFVNGGLHGLVYKGVDLRSGSRCAIKIAFPSDQQTAFEAVVLARLEKSPFTADFIYSALGVRPYRYLVFSEEGIDLAALQKPFSDINLPLDFPRTLVILHDIVQGLEFLHKKGVIHRDLHQRNVLLSRSQGKRRVVLCDFGLSAIRRSDGTFQCQRNNSLLGSVFSTPLFVKKGSDHCETDDLYSVVYLTLLMRDSKLAAVPEKKVLRMKKDLFFRLDKTLPKEEKMFHAFFRCVFDQSRGTMPDHQTVLRSITAIEGYNDRIDVSLPDPLPFPLTVNDLKARVSVFP